MFDFNDLLQKLKEPDQQKNIDIKQYATNMWKALMRPKNDEFFDELSNNNVNPYPISITYHGQNELWDRSLFDCKYYKFDDKEYDMPPEFFVDSLVVTSNVKSIPNKMFEGLVALKTVTFEDGSSVEHIGDECFFCCSSLRHINLPPTLTTLGHSVFRECTSLSTVNMETCNVVTIPNYTFYQCFRLKTISFPSSLKSVHKCSFRYCKGLTHLSLPGSIESFGQYCIFECPSLKVLYLPSNIVPEDFARYITLSNDPNEIQPIEHYYFNYHVILLFDKVDGVQWGTVTSDDEKSFVEGYDDRDGLDEDLDDEDFDDDDDDDEDDESDDGVVFRDSKDFRNLAPFISLFDINNHIRSIEPTADPSVIMKWLSDNSDGFNIAVEGYKMSILHILCHFPSSCDQVYECVNELLHKCPLMIECVDNTGRTALHHIIEFNPKRDQKVVRCLALHSNGTVVFAMLKCEQCETDVKLAIIESIGCAKHDALKCEDEETGLLPFMFVSMGEEYNLSVAFKLLQKMPDYLKNVQV